MVTVKLFSTSVPMDIACDGDLLPSVLGVCLYRSVEVVLAKAAVPTSSPGRVTFPVSLGIKIYQA